jgi:hypothetical protein
MTTLHLQCTLAQCVCGSSAANTPQPPCSGHRLPPHTGLSNALEKSTTHLRLRASQTLGRLGDTWLLPCNKQDCTWTSVTKNPQNNSMLQNERGLVLTWRKSDGSRGINIPQGIMKNEHGGDGSEICHCVTTFSTSCAVTLCGSVTHCDVCHSHDHGTRK